VRESPITTVIFLALASMLGLGAGFVLTQFGLRWMAPWVGAAISIPSSTLLFWCLAPIYVNPSEASPKAVVLFACVGLFFPGTVALLNFESNRQLGPNIAGTLSSPTPVFAVLLAIVILDERVRAAAIARPGRDRCRYRFDVPGPCQFVGSLALAAGLAGYREAPPATSMAR
jgi:drug/metabolite transporter (DMT)-like permease